MKKASINKNCPEGCRFAIQLPDGSRDEALAYATRILGYRREDVVLRTGHIVQVRHKKNSYTTSTHWTERGWTIFVKNGAPCPGAN